MNDLDDTNKMVDTPRTEAEVNRSKCWSDDLVTIDANFACQLERELNEANDRIKRLEEFARTIENDFDHDEDAHRYGTTCRVCDAEDLLKETKAKEAKL